MIASVASMIDQFNMENIRILQELGYEVHVACNFESGSTSSRERVAIFRQELESRKIRIKQVDIPRSIGKFKSILGSYKELKNYIEKEEFHLVHCHSPIGGVVARFAGRQQRKKGMRMIYTAHGFHFFRGASFINWCTFYPVEKLCAHYTDLLITINHEDYELAKRKLHARQVVYVPGIGVNTRRIAETTVDAKEKKKMLGISEGNKVVLGISELSTRKNCVTSIKAFAKAKLQDTVLVLCGKGPMEEELKHLAKELGVEKEVIFVGFRTDVYELLAMSDLFCFPSRQEGLPVALMEAMAAGLPVLCSKIRGNVDLIQDGQGGCLLHSDDVDGFSEKIRGFLSDEKRRLEAGRYNLEAIKRFDVEVVNKRMEQLYRGME